MEIGAHEAVYEGYVPGDCENECLLRLWKEEKRKKKKKRARPPLHMGMRKEKTRRNT